MEFIPKQTKEAILKFLKKFYFDENEWRMVEDFVNSFPENEKLRMSTLIELVEREHEDYVAYVSGSIFVDARIATMVVNDWLDNRED